MYLIADISAWAKPIPQLNFQLHILGSQEIIQVY